MNTLYEIYELKNGTKFAYNRHNPIIAKFYEWCYENKYRGDSNFIWFKGCFSSGDSEMEGCIIVPDYEV